MCRIGIGVLLRRGRGHLGGQALAHVVWYLTLLIPAYLMSHLLMVDLHGVAPGVALDVWGPVFLLLSACLFALHALVRVFVQGKQVASETSRGGGGGYQELVGIEGGQPSRVIDFSYRMLFAPYLGHQE